MSDTTLNCRRCHGDSFEAGYRVLLDAYGHMVKPLVEPLLPETLRCAECGLVYSVSFVGAPYVKGQ